MERIIKAKELKPGDQFKMNKQRVFRTVGKIVPVTKETWEENSFKALEGKMLIILSDCRQIVIEPETEVKCLRHSRMAEQVDFIFFRMKDKSFREWKDFYEAYCFREIVTPYSVKYVDNKAISDISKGIFKPPSRTGKFFEIYIESYAYRVSLFKFNLPNDDNGLPF